MSAVIPSFLVIVVVDGKSRESRVTLPVVLTYRANKTGRVFVRRCCFFRLRSRLSVCRFPPFCRDASHRDEVTCDPYYTKASFHLRSLRDFFFISHVHVRNSVCTEAIFRTSPFRQRQSVEAFPNLCRERQMTLL